MKQLTMRPWQSQFARNLAGHRGADFLLVACPAAGKTIGAGAAVAKAMAQRRCDQLIVVCPTVVVRNQWCKELRAMGYEMLTRFGGDGWPAWVHGVCVTYAQVAQRPDRYRAASESRRTVVIFDEIHHAGENLAWGAAIADAFAAALLRLALSGTPFRSDKDRIPFVRYARDGSALADFAYDYGRAVREGVCRPIEFRAHDGLISWRDGEETVTARFSDRVPVPARSRRLRASLDPSKPYLAALLGAAHADLIGLREEVPDAAGLVICDSQAHARLVDGLIGRVSGSLAVVAMSDLPRAHEAIVAFSEQDEEWLCSVRMVSEGVDIPRLGVIAWATAATTELMVRQVAGRALRGREEFTQLPAIVHMPADPELVRHAERMRVLGGATPVRHLGASQSEPAVEGDRVRQRAPVARAHDYRAVDARPIEGAVPRVLAPDVPRALMQLAGEVLAVEAPALPPSPRATLVAARRREANRGELFRLLSVYGELRHAAEPAYQLATAHRDLTTAVGRVDHSSADGLIEEALNWVREQLRYFAQENPDSVKELARARRMAIAS